MQGARLNEAQAAPLIDSQGIAMGIPVGEKPLLPMQRYHTACAAFVCPEIFLQAAFHPQMHCPLKRQSVLVQNGPQPPCCGTATVRRRAEMCWCQRSQGASLPQCQVSCSI